MGTPVTDTVLGVVVLASVVTVLLLLLLPS